MTFCYDDYNDDTDRENSSPTKLTPPFIYVKDSPRAGIDKCRGRSYADMGINFGWLAGFGARKLGIITVPVRGASLEVTYQRRE